MLKKREIINSFERFHVELIKLKKKTMYGRNVSLKDLKKTLTIITFFMVTKFVHAL